MSNAWVLGFIYFIVFTTLCMFTMCVFRIAICCCIDVYNKYSNEKSMLTQISNREKYIIYGNYT